MTHDDLPRSPTGRVPRWVAEEAGRVPRWASEEPAGRTSVAAEWRPYGQQAPEPAPPEPPRRRHLLVRLGVVVVVALVGWWVATSVLPGLLRDADAPFLDGVVAGRVPEPAPEVAALADEMFLTEQGRDLLYMSEPELLGAEEFAGRCERDGDASAGGTVGAVGCYHSVAGGIETGGRIVIYTPEDERLRGFVVATAAHELLHAAWTDLSAEERTTATAALEEVLRTIDPEDDLHTQLAGSVGTHPENRPTELFAYIGSQTWQDGGLGAELEAIYGRYIADRAALVAVHTAHDELISTMTADVTAAQQALSQRQYEQASGNAQLQADEANLAQYRGTIEQEEAALAAMPASQRARTLLAWTWRDGTALPEAPAAELLADARALLARDEAEIATRRAALEASAAEIAAEEARVAELRADLEGLFSQLDPTGA